MKRDLTGEQRRIIADLARDIFNDLGQADGLAEYDYDEQLGAHIPTGELTDAAERVIEARLLKFFQEGGNV